MRVFIILISFLCVSFGNAQMIINSYFFDTTTAPISDTSYRSIEFDGVNEYMSMSSSLNTVIRLDSAHTLNWWYKGTVAANDYMFADYNSTNNRYFLYLNTSGQVHFESQITATPSVRVETINTINDSAWHMITIYNPASGQSLIYLDGDTTTVNSIDIAGVATKTANGTFQIGANGAGAGDFPGKLTHFSAWNKLLNSSEITELYNSGKLLDLTTHSASANLTFWLKVVTSSDPSVSNGVVDVISGVNGTGVNMESTDVINDIP